MSETDTPAPLASLVAVAKDAIVEAVDELLDDVPFSIHDTEFSVQEPPESQVAAIITLSGKCSGLISLHTSVALASHLARVLNMIKEEELDDEDVRDAFGELCNIVAGNVKTRCIEKLHTDFGIGIPVVMLPDDDFIVPPPTPDVAAAVIHAKMAFCPLTLYLCLG